MQNYQIDSTQHNLDAYAQQENEEVQENIDFSMLNDEDEAEEEPQVETSVTPAASTQPIVVNDEELFRDIRSLNGMQRTIFDVAYDWSKTLVKLRNSIFAKKHSPFYIFLTGGAGCGKSHLLNTIYKALTKV